jgi:hypothetical protein
MTGSRKPRYIGYYRNHLVEFFYNEGDEKPWRFIFVVGSGSRTPLQWDDQPEPDLDSAKSNALELARERYGGPPDENWDEWLDLSADVR